MDVQIHPTTADILRDKNHLLGLLQDSSTRDLRTAIMNYNAARRPYIHYVKAANYKVGVYGAVAVSSDAPEYVFARDLTHKLVTAIDCDIVTGGGPGVLQAAIEGAYLAEQEAGIMGVRLRSKRIGVGVRLPSKLEDGSPLLDDYYRHDEYTTRLQDFSDLTHAAVIAPGGIGTFAELLYFMQLKHDNHIPEEFPIVIHPFWQNALVLLDRMVRVDRNERGEPPFSSVLEHEFLISNDISEIVTYVVEAHGREWGQMLAMEAATPHELMPKSRSRTSELDLGM